MLLAGSSKNVVDKPLELTVFRHEQDDLTLIDLPGMTRVAVGGQSEDIEETITKMYRRYMTPPEAVLLNVVSAMVDVSTSKSLQMSRELDTAGTRTLLCFTKVDQHAEPGLHTKIRNASTIFKCPVFCVRNRSQAENDEALSLDEARELERTFFAGHDELGELPEDEVGVAALSHKLVALQSERIRETLFNTRPKIKQRVTDLEKELAVFGEQPDSESSARAVFRARLEASTQALAAELDGRTQSTVVDDAFGHKVGTISVSRGPKSHGCIDHESHPKGMNYKGNTITLSKGTFITVALEQGTYALGLSLHLRSLRPSNGACTDERVLSSLTEKSESMPLPAAIRCPFSNLDCTLEITVTVLSHTTESRGSTDAMLCATLGACDEQFTSTLSTCYTGGFFFSAGFRCQVQKEVAARQGAAGLPGSIMPEVPLAIIRQLHKPLKGYIHSHVVHVTEAVKAAAVRLLVELFQDVPQLHRIVSSTVDEFIETQQEIATQRTADLLDWESTVLTKNHYFMDTVQSMRKHLLETPKEDQEEEPPKRFAFLSGQLAALRAMSNDQQRIVDLQIEIYAYWKTMRKRLIDYVALATRTYIARYPITDGHLRRVVEQAVEDAAQRDGSPGLMTLMSARPEQRLKYEGLKRRLKNLNEAMRLLNEHC